MASGPAAGDGGPGFALDDGGGATGAPAAGAEAPLARGDPSLVSLESLLVADVPAVAGSPARQLFFNPSSALTDGAVVWSVAVEEAGAPDAARLVDLVAAVRLLLALPPAVPSLDADGSAAIVLGRVREATGKRVVKSFVAMLPRSNRLVLVPNNQRDDCISAFVRAQQKWPAGLPALPVADDKLLELHALPWYLGRKGADPGFTKRAAAMTAAFSLAPALAVEAAAAGAPPAEAAGHAPVGAADAAGDATGVAAAAAVADAAATVSANDAPAAAAAAAAVTDVATAAATAAAPVQPAAGPALPALHRVPEWLYVGVLADPTETQGADTVRLQSSTLHRRGGDIAWAFGTRPAPAEPGDAVDLVSLFRQSPTAEAVAGPMLFLARCALGGRSRFAVIADTKLRIIEAQGAGDSTWRTTYNDVLRQAVNFSVTANSLKLNFGVYLHIPSRGRGRRLLDAVAVALDEVFLGRQAVESQRALSLTNMRSLRAPPSALLSGVTVADTGRFAAFAAASVGNGAPLQLASRTLGHVMSGLPQHAGRFVTLPSVREQTALTTTPGAWAATTFPKTTTLHAVLQWICGMRPDVPSGTVERRELPDVGNLHALPVAWARRALEFQTSRCKLVPERVRGAHVTTSSWDSDQFGVVARDATVLPTLKADAFERGAQFLCDMHTDYTGEKRRIVDVHGHDDQWAFAAGHRQRPPSNECHIATILAICGGEFSDGPAKWLIDAVDTAVAFETMIYAMGLWLIVLETAGPSCKAADVHSHLSIASGTSFWAPKEADIGGPDKLRASSVNVGNASGAQPFKISISTVRPAGDADPQPDAASDYNLHMALQWMFAVTPLMTQALPSALVPFKLRLAEARDCARAFHQVFHPVAVIAGLLLYMAAPAARGFRFLHFACWTYGNKLHGQILATRAEHRALIHGSDAEAADAAMAIARRLRQALGDDSPHALVSAFRNLVRAKRVTASHGLGLAHTAADANGRSLIAWPRILGAMGHFDPAFQADVEPAGDGAAATAVPTAGGSSAASAAASGGGPVGAAAGAAAAAGIGAPSDGASLIATSVDGASTTEGALAVASGGDGSAESEALVLAVPPAAGAKARDWRLPVGRALGGCHPFTRVPRRYVYTKDDNNTPAVSRDPSTWAPRESLLAPQNASATVYSTGATPTWACSITMHLRHPAPPPVGDTTRRVVVHRSEHYQTAHNAVAATGTRGGGDLHAVFGEVGFGTTREISSILRGVRPFCDEVASARIAMGPRPVMRSEIASEVDASNDLEWRTEDVAQQIYHLGRPLRLEGEESLAAVDAADVAAFSQVSAGALILGMAASASVLGYEKAASRGALLPGRLLPTFVFFANTLRQMRHFYNPYLLDPCLVDLGKQLGRIGLGPLPADVEVLLGPVDDARPPEAALPALDPLEEAIRLALERGRGRQPVYHPGAWLSRPRTASTGAPVQEGRAAARAARPASADPPSSPPRGTAALMAANPAYAELLTRATNALAIVRAAGQLPLGQYEPRNAATLMAIRPFLVRAVEIQAETIQRGAREAADREARARDAAAGDAAVDAVPDGADADVAQ